MQTEPLLQLVIDALNEMKGRDLAVLDLIGKTTVMDYMVIASGTSERHVKAMAGRLVERAKAERVLPLGIEGERAADWIVVDLGDVTVHLMLPQTRAFYNLEKLWSVAPALTGSESAAEAEAETEAVSHA